MTSFGFGKDSMLISDLENLPYQLEQFSDHFEDKEEEELNLEQKRT